MLGLDTFFRKPRKYGYQPVLSDPTRVQTGAYSPGEYLRARVQARRRPVKNNKTRTGALALAAALLLLALIVLLLY